MSYIAVWYSPLSHRIPIHTYVKEECISLLYVYEDPFICIWRRIPIHTYVTLSPPRKRNASRFICIWREIHIYINIHTKRPVYCNLTLKRHERHRCTLCATWLVDVYVMMRHRCTLCATYTHGTLTNDSYCWNNHVHHAMTRHQCTPRVHNNCAVNVWYTLGSWMCTVYTTVYTVQW